MPVHWRLLTPLVLLIGLAANVTATQAGETEPVRFPETQYEPVDWAGLDGWSNDDHAAAFSTFLASCRALAVTKQRPTGIGSSIFDALKGICARAVAAIPLDEDGARQFFEDNFRLLRVNTLGASNGFLTGYYEPCLLYTSTLTKL